MDGVVERPLLLVPLRVGVEEGNVELDRLVHVERQVRLVEVRPVRNLQGAIQQEKL